MKSSGFRVCPQSKWLVSLQDERDGEVHSRRPCEDGGSDCSDAATSQGMLRVAGSHQELGRGEEGSFPRASRESRALPTP